MVSQTWDPEAGEWVSPETTAPASPDVAAEQAILGDYGDEADAFGLLETLAQFELIISGPFGAA